ncbi:hypothetical protein [Kineobactrum sediminis]|nr:hypothetical protein [Kineobactrum sediminis]
MGKRLGNALLLFVLGATTNAGAQYDIETRLATCATLDWSDAVHQSYPDIDEVCQGVYEKDGVLYAQVQVEVIRVVGNRLTIRTVHRDGSTGHQASVRTSSNWRVTIEGRQYPVGELVGGQILTVYVPEDRFVFAREGVAGKNAGGDAAEQSAVEQ